MPATAAPDPRWQASQSALMQSLREVLLEQQEDPQNSQLHYKRGCILAQLGNFEHAAASYREALSHEPGFSAATYNLGIALHSLGHLEEAASSFQNVLERDQDPAAWARLGAVQEDLGQLRQAIASYAEAMALEPAQSTLRLRQAHLLLTLGDPEQAAELFRQLTAENTQNGEAWNGLGLAHYRCGNMEKARECYDEAIRGSESGEAWSNLGNLLLAQGDESGAARAYYAAVDRAAGNADLWFNLGEFCLQRDHPLAERALWQSVRLAPQDQQAWRLLLNWYEAHPNAEQQQEVLTRLTEFSPTDAELLERLATLRQDAGDQHGAVEIWERLCALEDADEVLRVRCAQAFCDQEEVKKTWAILQRVRTPMSVPESLWIRVGIRLLHRGDLDSARIALEHALAQLKRAEASDAEAINLLHLRLGELAWQQQRALDAFRHLNHASTLANNRGGLWLLLASALRDQGYPHEALACIAGMDEVLRYRYDLWPQVLLFFPKEDPLTFLQRLEGWLRSGLLPHSAWETLAGLYAQCGMEERAEQCRQVSPPPLPLRADAWSEAPTPKAAAAPRSTASMTPPSETPPPADAVSAPFQEQILFSPLDALDAEFANDDLDISPL